MNEKGIQFAYNKEHINILYKLKKKKKRYNRLSQNGK